MVDWQTISYIAMALVVIVAISTFIWEVKSSRKERAFSIFLRLLDLYSETMTERRQKWKTIKEKVRANPKTLQEIGEKTSSLDYLLTKTQQSE